LIEVLVVMVILGVALAVLVARGPLRSQGLDARAAASDLAQTLRLGRSRAIANDRAVPVVLDLPTRRLTLDGTPRFSLPASFALDVVMEDGSAPARQAVFVFAPDGSATGGSIALALGARRLAVTVDWLTGRVDVTAR
jgi:general secretion pathway protein H